MLSFDPNLGEEKIGELVSKIEDKAKSFGGEVERVERWGVKRLASTFKKARKLTQAYFVMVFIKGEKSLPGKLQSYLKVSENIVRYSILKGVPKPQVEISGKPVEAKGEIEAVDVGEIKEVGEKLGES
jgi:small subunit ribosomal protein S6